MVFINPIKQVGQVRGRLILSRCLPTECIHLRQSVGLQQELHNHFFQLTPQQTPLQRCRLPPLRQVLRVRSPLVMDGLIRLILVLLRQRLLGAPTPTHGMLLPPRCPPHFVHQLQVLPPPQPRFHPNRDVGMPYTLSEHISILPFTLLQL